MGGTVEIEDVQGAGYRLYESSDDDSPACLLCPRSWLGALDALADCHRFLICGPAHSGKSTFSRMLTNSLLSQSDVLVGCLDLDPGQTHHTPPVTLSVDLKGAVI